MITVKNYQKRKKMNLSREEIIKQLTEQLDFCLESINGEIYDYSDKIVDLDTEKQTITIKFDYHVVEEDDYIGLASY